MAAAIRAETAGSVVLRRAQLGRELGRTSAIWEPTARSGRATTDEVRRRSVEPADLPEPIAAAIAAAIARPLDPGESSHEGHTRRERELRCLFAGLPQLQRYALRRRLERDDDNDALAVAFRRLVGERRLRLLALLVPGRGTR